MKAKRDFKSLMSTYQAARVQFINTELDLAITFCQIAIRSDDSPKSERNTENAEQAYGAAKHFLGETALSSRENLEINEKLSKLDLLFDQLKKRF